MVKQLTTLSQVPSVDTETKSRATHLIDLAAAAQKFTLPAGGVLLEDNELKALEGVEVMRLPHQFVALECQSLESSGKAITFAREHIDAAAIAVTPVHFAEANGCWTEYPTFFIPTDPTLAIAHRDGGRAHITLAYSESVADDGGKRLCNTHASIVLSFMNALQCSNVHVARSEQRQGGKKAKTAFPFDTYHVLTIDVPGRASGRSDPTGPHRAPREHLRRGHIRRLTDGRRIWVNATVVAAGRGAGIVKKDYALRCGRQTMQIAMSFAQSRDFKVITP